MKKPHLPKLLIAWGILALPLCAGQGPRIAGVVEDPAGAVIVGARVTLYTAEQAILGTVNTNQEGRFSFPAVPAGSHVLQVSSRGFVERRIPVDLYDGGAERLSVVLDIQPPWDQVSVTANPGSAEDTVSLIQAVNVIEADTIRERVQTVLAQVANEEAGVHLQRTSPAIAGIYVRGLTGNKVNVFVDGVRYTTAAQRGGINTFFDMLEPANFQAIEILRGPNSAQYGSDAIGGSVQLVSRIPEFSPDERPRLGGSSTLTYNSADAGFGSQIHSAYATKNLGLLLSLAGRRVNTLRPGKGLDSHSAYTRFFGLRSDLFIGARLPDTAFTQYGGMIKMNWALTQDSQLILHYSRSQQDGSKRYDQMLGGDGNLVADLRNLMMDLAYVRYEKYRLGWLDSFSAGYSFNAQREERVNQGGSGNPLASINHEPERTTVHGVQLQAGKRWTRRQRFNIGAEYYHEGIQALSFRVTPATGAIADRRPRVPNGARYDSGGLYVQNEFDAFPDRLKLLLNVRYSAASYRARAVDSPLVGGARLWRDDSVRVSDLTFRAGMIAATAPGLRVFANISRGFRAPNMTDLGTFGLTGSGFEVAAPDVAGMGATIGTSAAPSAVSTGREVRQIQPESSLNYEAGARYRTRRIRADVSFFVNDIADGITKHALILPQGALGKELAGQTVTAQSPGGAVFVATASNPVLVRANYKDIRIRGVEGVFDFRIRNSLSIGSLLTYVHAQDLESGLPPEIEGGTPAPDAYLRIRYSPAGGRYWVEPYMRAAARQDRISSLALEDRRTGAGRSRSSIRNFFLNGATYQGQVGPGTDGKAGTADDILRLTGETLAQIQDRVLGPGVDSNSLFTALPGYVTFNVRGGIRLGERHDIQVQFENIGDRNYRGVSWGVDAPGRGVSVSYRMTF